METQRRSGRRGTAEELNQLTQKIIGAAIEVHRHLGPGLLESVYEVCLAHELTMRGHSAVRQKPLPVCYKGTQVDVGFRPDLLVDERVLVEVKATKGFHPIHAATTLNYIKLTDLAVGLLLNFNVEVMKDGIKRLVNDFPDSA